MCIVLLGLFEEYVILVCVLVWGLNTNVKINKQRRRFSSLSHFTAMCRLTYHICWGSISDVLKRSLNCLWEIKSVGKTYCKIILKVISCHVVSAGVLLEQIYNGNWWIKTRQFEFSLKRRSEFVQLSVNGDELSHKGILLCQQNNFKLLNFFSSLKTPRQLARLQPISLIDKKKFPFWHSPSESQIRRPILPCSFHYRQMAVVKRSDIPSCTKKKRTKNISIQ